MSFTEEQMNTFEVDELMDVTAICFDGKKPRNVSKAIKFVLDRAAMLNDDQVLNDNLVAFMAVALWPIAADAGMPRAAYDRAVSKALGYHVPRCPSLGVVASTGHITRSVP